MIDAPLMLGVSGLRGIVGQSLTPEVAARYAGAIGTWLAARAGSSESKRQPRKSDRPHRPMVVLSFDGRAGGDVILDAVGASLTAAGCDITRVGVAMTPTLGVLADALRASAGVQITASHNPQEWNGIKVLLRDADAGDSPNARAPDADTASQRISLFRDPSRIAWAPWDGVGMTLQYHRSLAEVHEQAVRLPLKGAGLRRGIKEARFRIALDCVGGSGAILTPRFLKKDLGCKVTLTGAHARGRFPHPPEPTRANLAGFCTAVRKGRFDVGFAQDPDADRLAIIDERGNYIGEEYTLALAAQSLLSARAAGIKPRRRTAKRDTVIVANLSTSRMIDDIAAAHGARVLRTPVGEANVVAAMMHERAQGHDVALGGEGNGGVIWPEVTYIRDSLSAMALVLSLMARTGKRISELVEDIPAYAIEKRKVEIASRDESVPAVERIAAYYDGLPAAARAMADDAAPPQTAIDRQDGVRIDWPDRRAWLHVRASNTEPIMRLIAEAPAPDQAATILDEAAKVIGGPA